MRSPALLVLILTLVSGFVPRKNLEFHRRSSRLDETMSATTEAAPSLTQLMVENAMDHTCNDGEKIRRLKELGLKMEHIGDWKQAFEGTTLQTDASGYEAEKTPWHFGLSVLDESEGMTVGLVSFYVAYSSWSGRIMYLDRLELKGLNDEKEELILRILADVALELGCARLTWRVRINL